MASKGARRLFDEVGPWFEKAFAEHALDLDCRWELTMCTLPNPKEGGLVSQLMLYVEAPTRNGLQRLVNTTFISAGADEQWATNTVQDVTNSLRAQLDAIGDGFADNPVDLEAVARNKIRENISNGTS